MVDFFIFFTTMTLLFNILGDDIGFEEKTRISYVLSRGSQPRYQMTKALNAKSPLQALMASAKKTVTPAFRLA